MASWCSLTDCFEARQYKSHSSLPYKCFSKSKKEGGKKQKKVWTVIITVGDVYDIYS